MDFQFIFSFIFFMTIFLLICHIKRKKYEKTDYYRQTKNNFWKLQFNKGARGEYLIWKDLRKLGGYSKYLFNCYLPKNNGETTEIDVILLHESGIYVFESKNYSGWIYGNETQQYWTQVLYNDKMQAHKEQFFNPIKQNNVHLKWLKKYLNIDHEMFYSYIIFGSNCKLKKITLTSGQHHVIKRFNMLSSLTDNIKNIGTKLSPEQIDALYDKLYPLTQVDNAVKQAHIANVNKKTANK